MAFPEGVASQAWTRAGGKCECRRSSCGHMGRCNRALTARKWHAHHKVAVASGGSDNLSNCEALCIPCHENTRTYGG